MIEAFDGVYCKTCGVALVVAESERPTERAIPVILKTKPWQSVLSCPDCGANHRYTVDDLKVFSVTD